MKQIIRNKFFEVKIFTAFRTYRWGGYATDKNQAVQNAKNWAINTQGISINFKIGEPHEAR